MHSLYHLKVYCYARVLVFCLITLSIKTYAQSSSYDWLSRCSINVEYGLSFPTIGGQQSFIISSFPSAPQNETFVYSDSSFGDHISNLGYFGLELLYQVKPKLSIGLGLQHRRSYNYNSVMTFAEEKRITPNNLLVATTGLFSHHSSIGVTSLTTISTFELFQYDMSRYTQFSFEISGGLGISFVTLKSELNNVLLTMRVISDNSSQDNILGPGSIAPVTERSAPFSWQLGGGFVFKFDNFTKMKIGYKLIHLGHFIIMERPNNSKNLFILTSTNTNAQDQNLVVAATNRKRYIFSNDFYIRFYF